MGANMQGQRGRLEKRMKLLDPDPKHLEWGTASHGGGGGVPKGKIQSFSTEGPEWKEKNENRGE